MCAKEAHPTVIVGEKIVAAALDDAELNRLRENPHGVLGFPPKPELRVVVNTPDVTHVVIPSRPLVREMVAKVNHEGFAYPREYDSASGSYIDPGKNGEPVRAYYFRVGDYTFAQCG